MDLLLIASVAAGASLLTFFSGFGLGTLLLPVFAIYFPIESAVMMTAVVHLANNLFKLGLIHRYIDRRVLLRFGLTALAAAWIGAKLLVELSEQAAITEYTWWGRSHPITWTGLVVGGLMMVFALRELMRSETGQGFHPKWLPVGGVVSGFFGGLSGHQGALRSAFLIGCGLSKETYIATGVAIACLVDLGRLSNYLTSWEVLTEPGTQTRMGIAILAAFTGAWIGRRMLHKVTLKALHRLVGSLLLAAGIAIAAGLL